MLKNFPLKLCTKREYLLSTLLLKMGVLTSGKINKSKI